MGEVFFCDLYLGAGQDVYPYGTWRSDPRAAGGGTLMNQGTHALDLLRFVTGQELVEVSGVRDTAPIESVFGAVAVLEHGALATVSCHQRFQGTRPDFVVAGARGWLQAVRGAVRRVERQASAVDAAGLQRSLAPDGTGNLAAVEALYTSHRRASLLGTRTLGPDITRPPSRRSAVRQTGTRWPLTRR